MVINEDSKILNSLSVLIDNKCLIVVDVRGTLTDGDIEELF